MARLSRMQIRFFVEIAFLIDEAGGAKVLLCIREGLESSVTPTTLSSRLYG
jgi:hypothetical protein